jgi:hypothetical protein
MTDLPRLKLPSRGSDIGDTLTRFGVHDKTLYTLMNALWRITVSYHTHTHDDPGAQTERKVTFRFSDILPGVGGYATARDSLRSYRRNNSISLQVTGLVGDV